MLTVFPLAAPPFVVVSLFTCSVEPRHLNSFPPRRSSDLVPLLVSTALFCRYIVPPETRLIVPALLTGRASMRSAHVWIAAAYGRGSSPLPPKMPPLQFLAVLLMAIGAVALTVTPRMFRVG